MTRRPTRATGLLVAALLITPDSWAAASSALPDTGLGVPASDLTLPVQDLTLPVQDLTLPMQDLTFSEGSLDGALTDTGRQEFRLAADVLFAFDKANLTPRATGLIRTVAATLQQRHATRVTVTGYTDNVGGEAYNLVLSRRRAVAVQVALQAALGSGAAVSASGLGETHPIADNATPTGRAVNRRVEIRIG
jgi:outer membrane protein OmpA-like peptidoglycan-associated protein